MRTLKALLLALFMLALASPSFAEVGIKKDGALIGTATDLNFRSAGSSITSDGSTVTFNLALAGIGNGGVSQMSSSPTAVPVSYAVVRKHINSGNDSGTLANGTPGQVLSFVVSGVTSSGTFTITPATSTGFASLLFNAADDQVVLLYVNDTTGWIILSSTSVTISH